MKIRDFYYNLNNQLNNFEKFKQFYMIVFQKMFYKYKVSFTNYDKQDQEKFDLLITVDDGKKVFVKFRTAPTKTELKRYNEKEFDSKEDFLELYIYQSDVFDNNIKKEYTQYIDKFQFKSDLNIGKLLFDEKERMVFWGEKVFSNLKDEYALDYYLYYDDSIKIDELDIKTHSKKLTDILKKKLVTSSRKFTFVLGAGVSIDYDIPKWDDLLDSYINKLKTKVTLNEEYIFEKIGDTSLIKAQFIVDNFSEDQKQSAKEYKFCQELKKMFYSSKKYNQKSVSSLKSVVKCIERYNETQDGVVTYNYDDLLEKTLECETQLTYQTIYQDDELKASDLNIYHVHGYIPREGHLRREHSNSIILSEQKYNYLFNNPLSWQISNQLTRFRENLCILVGLSISDPSLRRLLENVKLSNSSRFHYAIIARKSNNHHPSIKDILIITKHFERIGVHLIWVDDYTDIPYLIDSL